MAGIAFRHHRHDPPYPGTAASLCGNVEARGEGYWDQ
jgi:hypothetical protein